MCAHGLPLFADANVVSFIIFIVMAIGWLINQLSGKAQAPRPPVQRGKPPRPRPDRERLQDEIDVFIQEVTGQRTQSPAAPSNAELARRRKRPETAAPQPPQPQAQTPRKRPGEDLAGRRSLVNQNLGTGVRTSVDELLGSERNLANKVKQDIAPRVGEEVASHLGSFGGSSRAQASAASTPDGSRTTAQRLKQVFHQPENVRQAILINAILTRPQRRR